MNRKNEIDPGRGRKAGPNAGPRTRHWRGLSAGLLLAVVLALTDNALAAPLQVKGWGLRSQSAYKHFDGLRQQGVDLKLSNHVLQHNRWLRGDWRLNASVGEIGIGAQDGGFVSIGPELGLRPVHGWPLQVDLGIAPTWLERARYGEGTLGGHFHFSSHLAVGWVLDRAQRLSLAYRLQHISNGGIRNANPGVDLMGLELQLRFGAPRPLALALGGRRGAPGRAAFTGARVP